MSIELRQAAEKAASLLQSFFDGGTSGRRPLEETLYALRAAIQQAEAQQPASKEPLFELWWEAHMPNATQQQARTAFTAAVASNGVGIAAQQPATGELEPYNAGLLNDFGGGNVEWWQDYIRAELGCAHDFYQSQIVTLRPVQAPMTDEQMRDALRKCPHDTVENLRVRWLYAKDFARAIEAHHGIKPKEQA